MVAEGHPHRRHRVSGRRSNSAAARSQWRIWISGSFLAIAIIFGGGGTPSPSTELVVELAALVAVSAWYWFAANDRGYRLAASDWPLLSLVGLVVAIPLLQLVPLPPAIWQRLPGRSVEVQALTLIGRANAWMPVSESPSRTVASVLSMIPSVAMLFMVSHLQRRDRFKLIGLVAALGLLAAIVGVFQLAGGHSNWFRFYSNDRRLFATGFQANRNAAADILLIAALALAAWRAGGFNFKPLRSLNPFILAAFIFLSLSVVLTGSRTGVVLIVVAMIAAGAMFVRAEALRSWKVVGGLVTCGVALVASLYFLTVNGRVQQTLQRFDTGEAVRPEIWRDAVYAIGQHWPVGSGTGTFQPVFAAAERLEFVRPEFSNRAHNDYLEYALEVGIAAPAVLAIILIFAAVRLRVMFFAREDGRQRILGLFVLGALLILALHSLVDYPERSLSLAVLTGMLGGLLGRMESGARAAERSSEGVVA